MKYKLIPNSNKGVLIDRTPILQDVRDTYWVSFLLPDEGSYIALFKGEDCIEYRKTIKDGICKLDSALLLKEQYVELTVCKLKDEKVLWSWECEPLKVSAFFSLRRTQWQLSGGMTDKDCLTRLAELEQLQARALKDFSIWKDEIIQKNELTNLSLSATSESTACLQKQNKELADSYNTAITVINDLSTRLKSLEKNYDPTVIE